MAVMRAGSVLTEAVKGKEGGGSENSNHRVLEECLRSTCLCCDWCHQSQHSVWLSGMIILCKLLGQIDFPFSAYSTITYSISCQCQEIMAACHSECIHGLIAQSFLLTANLLQTDAGDRVCRDELPPCLISNLKWPKASTSLPRTSQSVRNSGVMLASTSKDVEGVEK